MKNSELIFICNELLNPTLVKQLNLPLEFISFAIADGKMYSHFNNNGVFFIPLGRDMDWGNTKVYGAIYLIRDYFFYIDVLDAYHVCSKNKLKRNHVKDIHHRVEVKVAPIVFNSIKQLNELRYKERDSLNVIAYIGNIKHPKINQRFLTTRSYRKLNGVYESGFKKLFREV